MNIDDPFGEDARQAARFYLAQGLAPIPVPAGTKAPVKTLNDLGITSDESKRWQKLSDVPDDVPGFIAASLLSDSFC